MSYKNIVQKVAAGINTRNLGVLDEYFAADALDHDLPPGTPRGPASSKAKLSAFIAAFPDLKVEFIDVIEEGNRLAGRGTLSGTQRGAFNGIPASGKAFKVQFMDEWRIENGKVAEYWGAQDVLGILTQIGAIPAPQQETAAAAAR